MNNYKISIDFYFKAKDEDEALHIADSIANHAEESDMVQIDAKVGEAIIIGDDK